VSETFHARMTENQLLDTVMQLAKFYHWQVTHFRPAWTESGWRTPLSGHKGFPDLVLARRGIVLIVELKTEKGRVTKEQERWAEAIGDQYRLWRPRDLESIKEELR
jgi:VRR-NUC domain